MVKLLNPRHWRNFFYPSSPSTNLLQFQTTTPELGLNEPILAFPQMKFPKHQESAPVGQCRLLAFQITEAWQAVSWEDKSDGMCCWRSKSSPPGPLGQAGEWQSWDALLQPPSEAKCVRKGGVEKQGWGQPQPESAVHMVLVKPKTLHWLSRIACQCSKKCDKGIKSNEWCGLDKEIFESWWLLLNISRVYCL